jgi:hypothetical protein
MYFIVNRLIHIAFHTRKSKERIRFSRLKFKETRKKTGLTKVKKKKKSCVAVQAQPAVPGRNPAAERWSPQAKCIHLKRIVTRQGLTCPQYFF